MDVILSHFYFSIQAWSIVFCFQDVSPEGAYIEQAGSSSNVPGSVVSIILLNNVNDELKLDLCYSVRVDQSRFIELK